MKLETIVPTVVLENWNKFLIAFLLSLTQKINVYKACGRGLNNNCKMIHEFYKMKENNNNIIKMREKLTSSNLDTNT